MKALFLITETIDGKKIELMDYCNTFHYIKDARKELMYQLETLSSHENVNEIQPTMNFKDRFHFWIDGEKRNIVISKFYKSEKCSIRMLKEAELKLQNFSNPV